MFSRAVAVIVLALSVATSATAPAWGSAAEERQGAALLQQVQSGKTICGKLTAGQQESIGEYVMGRMLGSTSAHDAMDRQITTTMGSRGERQAHEFMGRRFAGCAAADAPASFGAMMGMMGAGMMGSSQGYGAGRYGGGPSGGMMGNGSVPGQTVYDNDMGGGWILLIVLGAVALSAVVAVGISRRGAGHGTHPSGVM